MAEYPQERWQVIAFDHNNEAMMIQKHVSRETAEELGDKWFSRPDVLRVEGKEVIEKWLN